MCSGFWHLRNRYDTTTKYPKINLIYNFQSHIYTIYNIFYIKDYTPCISDALCNDGITNERYEAVYFDRFSGLCEYYLAQWNDEIKPIFRYNRDDDGIYTWTFTYTNGEECNGGVRTFEVVWKCDEDVVPFGIDTLCQNNEDECYTEMIIPTAYACVEGPSADPTMDPTLEPTFVPTLEPTLKNEESESGSGLEDKDAVIISLSVILFVALVIIAGLIYCLKCRKGDEHVLLRDKSNNEYNTMKDDNLQLTTKE